MKFYRSEIKNKDIRVFCNLMPDMVVGAGFDKASYECFLHILEFTGIFDIDEGDAIPNNFVECSCYAYSIRKYKINSGYEYLVKDDLSGSTVTILTDKAKIVNQIAFHTTLF